MKLLLTDEEHTRLLQVVANNPEFNRQLASAGLKVILEIVEALPEIPEGYVYDTETDSLYVYRHKYTGDEILIPKDSRTFLIEGEEVIGDG